MSGATDRCQLAFVCFAKSSLAALFAKTMPTLLLTSALTSKQNEKLLLLLVTKFAYLYKNLSKFKFVIQMNTKQCGFLVWL